MLIKGTLAAAAIMALTGCGVGNMTTASDQPSESATVPAAVAPTASATKTEAEVPGITEVAPGKSATVIQGSKADANLSIFDMKVTSWKCVAKLRNLATNPAYASGDWSAESVPPERIDAVAGPGMQLCIVFVQQKNTENVPEQVINLGESVRIKQNGELKDWKQTAADSDLKSNEETDIGLSSDWNVNPGQAKETVQVVSIPKGASLDGLYAPMDTLMATATHLFLVSPANMKLS
jgi:hypothetical protein